MMKRIAVASIACLVLVAGSAAQAAPAMSSFEADTTASLYQDSGLALGGVPYDRCHHQASGTSHAACGSLTGGPSGSLF